MKMQQLIQLAESSEPIARAATTLSITSASFAWLGVVNDILTAIATIIAIISGLYAIRFYYKKSQDPDKKEGEDETQ